MRKLSIKEWVAAAVAVVFMGYVFFGGEITSFFNKGFVNNDELASVAGSNPTNGVNIEDIVVGNGQEIKAGQLVSVNYVLALSDGTVVQDSRSFGQPFQFVLGVDSLIPGWEMGLQGMKVGGVRRVIIPPELAYGNVQVDVIPPNSTLVFTIELVDSTEVPPQPVQ